MVNNFEAGTFGQKNKKKKSPSRKKRDKDRGKRYKHEGRYSENQEENFYRTEAWLKLRYKVLKKYEAKCMACGKSPKEHGIVLCVDHIKPRSKYPHLSLSFNNLQLLCWDCDQGKSNLHTDDWRPDKE